MMRARNDEARTFRRFFGRSQRHLRSVGQRFEGSVDDLTAALASVGYGTRREPIENGLPDPAALGVIRTSGSRWVDVLPHGYHAMLSDELLGELACRSSRRTFTFDYDPAAQRWCHRLFDGRQLAEELVAGPEGIRHAGGGAARMQTPINLGGVDDYVEALLLTLRTRDLGIDRERLAQRDLPFPLTALTEAWFIVLIQPPGGKKQ